MALLSLFLACALAPAPLPFRDAGSPEPQAGGAPAQPEAALEEEPEEEADDELGRLTKALRLMRAKRYDEAVAILEAQLEENDKSGFTWYLLGSAASNAGDLERGLAASIRGVELGPIYDGSAYNAACTAALLGRNDEAFRWLKRASELGFGDAELLGRDEDLLALHGDPRWAKIVARVEGRVPTIREEPDVIVEIGGPPGAQLGASLANAGDVDGDGSVDLACGAPHAGEGGAVLLLSVAEGEVIGELLGREGERFGFAVASGFDLDGDGRSDVLVGAPGTGDMPGRAVAYSGADGRELFEIVGDAPGDRTGASVDAADLDGDGRVEVLVGAPGAGRDAGRVIVAGADGFVRARIDGAPAERLGERIAARGGGGRFAVGASRAGAGGRGVVRVFEGAEAPALLFEITPDDTASNFGRAALAWVGDRDGDGVADLACGDEDDVAEGFATGRLYVVRGADGERIAVLSGTAGSRFGADVGVGDDLDGDGLGELGVGASLSGDAAVLAGRLVLVSSRDGAELRTYTNMVSGDAFASAIAPLGDVDGDGRIDWAIGAPWNDVDGAQAGRVYVVSGSPEIDWGEAAGAGDE